MTNVSHFVFLFAITQLTKLCGNILTKMNYWSTFFFKNRPTRRNVFWQMEFSIGKSLSNFRGTHVITSAIANLITACISAQKSQPLQPSLVRSCISAIRFAIAEVICTLRICRGSAQLNQCVRSWYRAEYWRGRWCVDVCWENSDQWGSLLAFWCFFPDQW